MKNPLKLAICGTVLMAAALIPTVSHADEWDKKTFLTFSGPVQVPGMTLDAGKYVFKVTESSSDRFIVQVLSDSEQHLYTTLLAIPNYHMTTPEKTIVTFYEAPSGQPQPLKAWFYPGDNYGRQFVYPKSEAALIAQAAHETVPTDTTTATASAPVTAPTDTSTQTQTTTQEAQPATVEPSQAVSAQPSAEPSAEPSNEPVLPENNIAATPAEPAAPVAVPTTEPDQTPAPAPTPDTTAPSTDNSALPATASNWPLVAFLGILSILGAISLRFATRLS
jgi:hypothetical protein